MIGKIFEKMSLIDVVDDTNSLSSEGVCRIINQNLPVMIKQIMSMLRGNKNAKNSLRYYVQHFISEFIAHKKPNIVPGSLELNKNDTAIFEDEKSFLYSNKDVNIRVKWERNPALPPLNLDEIKVNSIKLTGISDADIAEYKEKLLDQFSSMQESDQPLEKGDLIQMKWELDDEAQEFEIVLGVKPRLQEDLENKLLGMTPGGFVEHEFEIGDVIKQLSRNNANLPRIKNLRALQKTISKINCKIHILMSKRRTKSSIEEILDKLKLKSEDELNSAIKGQIESTVKTQNQYFFREQLNLILSEYDLMIPNVYLESTIDSITKSLCEKYGLEYVSSNRSAFVKDLLEKLAENGKNFENYDELMKRISSIARKTCIRMYMHNQIFPALKISDPKKILLEKYPELIMEHYNKNSKNLDYIYELVALSELYEYLQSKEQVSYDEFDSIESGFKHISEWFKSHNKELGREI